MAWLLLVVAVGLVIVLRVLRRAWCRRLTKDEAVLVTGCDTGFGLSIVKALLNETDVAVFAGYITEEGRVQLTGLGDRVIPLPMDVTKNTDVFAAFGVVERSGKSLWGVVNNAGIGGYGYCENFSVERYEQNLNVNLLGTIRVTKLALPLLRQSKGRLVTIGSMGGRMPSAFGSTYLPTKAAQAAFQDCVRQEVYRFGVRCSLIEPGFFKTGMLHRAADASKRALLKSTNEDGTQMEVEHAYGSFSEKMKRIEGAVVMFEAINGGERGVNRVTTAVIDALTTVFPQTHYLVGVDANIMGRVGPFIPSWVMDLVQTYLV